MLILAAEVGARLGPAPEPVLGGRRIARLPLQRAAEALDFTRLIRAGETVGWAEATAEPVALTRMLDAQAARCAPFRLFFPLTFSNTLGASHPQVTVTALGGASAGRRFFAGGGSMVRRGIINGRQLCTGAPWVIKAEDLAAYREQKPSRHPLTPDPSQQSFQFQ